jgi:small basic protein
MKNTSKDLSAFKNRIFFHGILAALIVEAGSLPFLGFDPGFAYGLALGTAVSIVNFNILVYLSRRLLNSGRAWIGFSNYLVRLAVYGFAFYTALRVSLIAALGAALGFLTLKLAIYYVHGFKAPRRDPSEKRAYKVLPPEKRRRNKFMKEIFGSPYDDADGDDESKDDEGGF